MLEFLPDPDENASAATFTDSLVAAGTCGFRCFVYLEHAQRNSSSPLAQLVLSGPRAARSRLRETVAQIADIDVRSGREPFPGAPAEVAVTFLARNIVCLADNLTIDQVTEDAQAEREIRPSSVSDARAYLSDVRQVPRVRRLPRPPGAARLWWMRTGGAVDWLAVGPAGGDEGE